MYSDPAFATTEEGVRVGRVTVGQTGRLERACPTLCCSHVIPAGSEVTVMRRTSKKRVVVRAGVGCHKVKVSKLWFERTKE